MTSLREKIVEARETRRELKAEWANLWSDKYDDNRLAESLSTDNYEKLFVDKGQVLHASRDYKPLSFSEIYELHVGKDVAENASPHQSTGGWGKFAREHFSEKEKHRRHEEPKIKWDLDQQQRKGGDGWLNRIRVLRKIRESRTTRRSF